MAYTDAQRKAVVKRAVEAVQSRLDGKVSVILGRPGRAQNFDLDELGYCLRFVRQAHETALGIIAQTWEYRAGTAKESLAHLRKDGKQIALSARAPGDILGCPGTPGHIAIFVGDCYGDGRSLVCENTVSTRRGIPKAGGTKISSFADFVSQHDGKVTCYRV